MTVSGTVTPAHPGLEVARESFYGGAWHIVGRTTLSASSTYSFRVTPKTRGQHTLRVVSVVHEDHGTGYGPRRLLNVS